eukprot:COSAG01_NODE_7910_length_2997_cov_3.855418_1_plen_76_part_10
MRWNRYLDGQAGDTKRGVACIDQWLGGLDWDLVHMNFGLHDLNNACGTLLIIAAMLCIMGGSGRDEGTPTVARKRR